MPTQTLGFNLPLLQPISITSGPVVSVSQFGAIGNGKTDDTAAIQSALNYVKANGGTLNFEADRTYVVSKSLQIIGADDFKIDGNGATIKMANGIPVQPGTSILYIERSDHFAVTDLTVDGNRATRTPVETWAHNIHVRGSEDFSFSDVTSVNGIADGFYVEAFNQADRSSYSHNGLFLNCRADNSFRQGMSIINGENIQVIGGAYTNTHGTAPAAGIDVESDHGTAVPGSNNILIKGVTFSGNDGYGVQLAPVGNPTNVTVEGCYFANNDDGGINLGTSSTLIKGNTFENFSESFRGIIDFPAVAYTNSNNVVTENSFNNISTGHAVIYAHSVSGTNNKVYDNNFYNVDGPVLQSYTAGTTAWDNVITSAPTYPSQLPDPDPTPDPEPTPEPDPVPQPPPTRGSLINGTNGDDQLVATARSETIDGHNGTDRVSYLSSSSAVKVTLSGGTGAGGHAAGDRLISIENVLGSNHNDRLEGSDGNNRLDGAVGNDVINSGNGNDLISGGLGEDRLFGGTGNDWIYGNDGSDLLRGQAGDDVLFGQAGADRLYGNLANDVLWGDDGSDIMFGDRGNDRLIGGAGADQYVFDIRRTGSDTIEGFDVKADKLVVEANLNGNGINTAAQAVQHVHAGSNGDAVLDLGKGNSITFVGVTPAQLGTDDFIIT